jgi:small subunit ribosomal protein S16
MVRIRLRRVGLRNQPSYRIVVQDKEMPRDGRFLEIVGFYNPRTQPGTITIQEERVFDWMSKGALPTESVAQIFKTTGTLDRFARFKKGEAIETLLEEAKTAQAGRNAPVTTGNS